MSPKEKKLKTVARRGWMMLPREVRKTLRPMIKPDWKPAQQMPTKWDSVNSSWAPTDRLPTNGVIKSKGAKSPLLSVIIPVHNVERYLSECFDSVVQQSYKNLEIIVINDGSTDNSGLIIDSYAKKDTRISVVTLTHGGNGVARNVGIAAARGKYLTFVDSDDTVEPGAYQRMVQQLEKSGSDFVVGSFKRRKGAKTWLPQMMTETHSVHRVGIVIEEFPDIMRDIFLWNKVFRKSFWDAQVVAIPEGVLYEDQETIVRAYLRAAAFDVIRDVVYVWRIRDDNTSITQQKGDIKDLLDRMQAALGVTNLVKNEGDPSTRDAWFVKSLGEDLRPYIETIPNASEEYWGILQDAVGDLVDLAGKPTLERLTFVDRVLVHLIVDGNRDQVVNVLIALRDQGRTYRVREHAGQLLVDAPFLRGIDSVPDDLLALKPEDVQMTTRLLNMRWEDDAFLHIRAAAYIHGIDSLRFHYSVNVELLHPKTGKKLQIPCVSVNDDRIDQVSGDRWNTYANSVFDFVIPTVEILDAVGGPKEEWRVQATVSAAGIELTDVIRVRDGELLPFQLPRGAALTDRRVVAQIDRASGLRLFAVRHRFVAAKLRTEGSFVFVDFAAGGTEAPRDLVLKSKDMRIAATVTEEVLGRSFRFPMPTPSDGEEDMWEVLGSTESGQWHPVAWHGSSHGDEGMPPAGGAIRVHVTGYGYLRVSVRQWRVTVSGCHVDMGEASVKVTGRSAYLHPRGEQLVDLILATDRNVLRPRSITPIPGTDEFVAVFPLMVDKWGCGEHVPDGGHYRLTLRTIRSDGVVTRQRVQVAGELLRRMPEEHIDTRMRVLLTAEDIHRNFVVKVLPPFADSERGAWAQEQLRERNLTGQGQLDQNAVLFESFAGKSTSDSGKSISLEMGKRYPSLKRYWTVSDYSVPVPDGCKGVLRYSAEWYRLLNSAKYLVNNNNFPPYFDKREGQVYIQTWHGTPLKKIGNHTPLKNLTASYRQLMQREAEAWDVLLAQNEFAAEVLPSAFAYEGRMITAGYPRNDVLYSDSADTIRKRFREHFGIREDALVLLYAPTWRDNVKTAQNRFDTVNYLEFEKMVGALEVPTVILYRGHHNVADQRNTAGQSTFIDVTAFPEIADLYLACDVMITDYSSSMFDFCGTGKPMIFLAPDIAEYRDKTRGFYFDFESEAPGPIVTSTEEVASLLRNLPSVTSEYEDRYEAFVRKYASLDDGKAGERVVDKVFGPSTGATATIATGVTEASNKAE